MISLTLRNIFVFAFFFPLQNYAQSITTVAGGGTILGDGGVATLASIGILAGIVIDNSGNLIIANGGYDRVRKVNAATGIITTIAGDGTAGFSGDGYAATLAKINGPTWLTIDLRGNLYITDGGNNRIRRVDTAGIITTFAGNGSTIFADGVAATAASLNAPQGIATDIYGNLYIVDGAYPRIRKVDTFGIMTTIAGTGISGYSGDGGLATNAQFVGIYGICTDPAGNIFVADMNNARIRKIIVATGIISTVAGNGTTGFSGDGITATSAQLNFPVGMAIDDSGNIVIADQVNNRIRKVDTFGIIHSIVGTGVHGFSGDGGEAITAELYEPENVVYDVCGNMYIADAQNQRIRKVTYPPILTTPAISLSGIVAAPVGSTVTLTATVSSAGSSYIIHWLNHGVEFTATTVPAVTYTKPPGIDTITARIVPTGYGCYDSTISTAWYVAVGATGIGGTTASGISIYPNPAQSTLTIAATHPITSISISNIMGQVVTLPQPLAQAPAALSYNIGGLAPGMYIITVTDEQGNKEIAKFVKE